MYVCMYVYIYVHVYMYMKGGSIQDKPKCCDISKNLEHWDPEIVIGEVSEVPEWFGSFSHVEKDVKPTRLMKIPRVCLAVFVQNWVVCYSLSLFWTSMTSISMIEV